MTVQELIDHLQQLPPGQQVFVEGYENGWDSLIAVELGSMSIHEACEDWDGEFERLDGSGLGTEKGVLLVSRRGHRRRTE
jgi:hypothetical protein